MEGGAAAMAPVRGSPTWGERTLAGLFGSEVRGRIIAWLCLHGGGPVVGRELARSLALPAVTVSEELRRLAALGLVRAGDKVGTARPYYVDEACPLLPGLRSIVEHAVGPVALLRERLGQQDGIAVAFVYGSLASGADRANSDVDLFVVGDTDDVVLAGLVREVGRQSRREIGLVHWSAADLARRAQDPSSFLSAVMRQPKLFVKGDEGELRRLAGQ